MYHQDGVITYYFCFKLRNRSLTEFDLTNQMMPDGWHWQFDGLGEFVQFKILTIISYKSDFCCYNVNMRWGSGVLMNLYTLKNLSVRSYNSDFCCLNANLRCPIRYGLLVHQDGAIFFFQFWLKLTLRFICNLIKFLMSCECLIKMGLLLQFQMNLQNADIYFWFSIWSRVISQPLKIF